MFIIDTIKTIKALNKTKKVIKEHNDVIEKVKTLIATLTNGIATLSVNREDIQKRIDEAMSLKDKLKGIINK